MSNHTTCRTLTIQQWDGRGHGVFVDADGRITVPGALPREDVVVETYEHRGRTYGRLQAVLKPSPARVSTDCVFAATCPGCSLRAVDLDHQWQLKTERTLKDLGRYKSVHGPVEKLSQMPRDEARSRAVAHAMLRTDGRLVLGMRGRHGALIPLSDCPVHTQGCRHLLKAVENDLNRLNLTVYDPETRTGEVRHVIVEEFNSHYEEVSVKDKIAPSERVVICFGH